MAKFTNLTLTEKGLALQTKAQIGTQLRFTRVAIGDGTLDAADSLTQLTGLKSEKMSVTIANLTIDNGSAIIKANFSNKNLTESFYLRELGVFANDPNEGEILYVVAYAGDQSDYLPAYNGSEVIEQTFTLSLLVGSATDVTATFAESIYVLKAGDTMTGPLVLSGDPTTNLGAATKQYVDNSAVKKSGDIMTGLLVLSGDPTTNLNAATKQYVDNNAVKKSGDTMIGTLVLNGDPTANLHAVTKQYVDNSFWDYYGTADPTTVSGVTVKPMFRWADATNKIIKIRNFLNTAWIPFMDMETGNIFTNAATSSNATNVTTNINGHAITDILEADGITVRRATKASIADAAKGDTRFQISTSKLITGGESTNPEQMYCIPVNLAANQSLILKRIRYGCGHANWYFEVEGYSGTFRRWKSSGPSGDDQLNFTLAVGPYSAGIEVSAGYPSGYTMSAFCYFWCDLAIE